MTRATASGYRRGCSARQYSDQMCCARCGLQYDVNDPEPPECLTSKEVGQKELEGLKRYLANAPR